MTYLSQEDLQKVVAERAELEAGQRPKTRVCLNQAVADLSKAVAIIHQIHWYLRGPGFFSLHAKMDELMDDLNEHLDEMAERLITLGGSPYSTLKEFDQVSFLVEAEGRFDLPAQAHLERLVSVYRYLITLFELGLTLSDQEGDNPSNGLFSDAQASCEKTLWMLQAQLGRPAGLYD